MDYVLIGTAGHVDHGKSTLIKALSGIDPDRLKEEREREMTIDIGFANFLLPSGRCVQVIDVPGHERFVKNMLTGVNTIDLVLFLVDANEGVKPQTREHFDILRLLGIKTGIVVMTKIDVASKERLAEATEEVAELVKDSFLAKAPVVNVSAISGAGIPELVQTIDRLSPGIEKRNQKLPVRFPIDRVFAMSGSGTVITGTLVSGVLRVNDMLEILPQKKQVRVRQIQSYGGKPPEAMAGQRLGINLVGVKKEDLIRGNTLAVPGYLEPTYMFDATLELVPGCSRSLKNNARVRLHVGAAEFLGRVVLLDKEQLKAGERALIQFRSESPLVVVKDERFIIRFYAPVSTAGGGRILDPHPVKHKRFQAQVIEQLKALTSATPEESVARVLVNAGLKIVKLPELMHKVDLPQQEIEQILEGLEDKKEILRFDTDSGAIMHRHNLERLKEEVVRVLDEFHRKEPLRLNMPRAELNRRLSKTGVSEGFLTMAVAELARENRIETDGGALRMVQHSIQLTPEQERLRKPIEDFYQKDLFAPEGAKALTERLSIKPKSVETMIGILKETGILVGLPEGMVMHQAAVTKASKLMRDYLNQHESIKAGEFTRLLKTSRKYAIPLLEYFDSIKLTKREGDVRVLY